MLLGNNAIEFNGILDFGFFVLVYGIGFGWILSEKNNVDRLVNVKCSISCLFEFLFQSLYSIYLYSCLFAGMILTDKRLKLTPEFFEDLILLHMNE